MLGKYKSGEISKRFAQKEILKSTLKKSIDELLVTGTGTAEGKVHFAKSKPNKATLGNTTPDFFVKTNDKTFYILETKGREDLDDVRKIKHKATWCNDINTAQALYTYTPVCVKQKKW